MDDCVEILAEDRADVTLLRFGGRGVECVFLSWIEGGKAGVRDGLGGRESDGDHSEVHYTQEIVRGLEALLEALATYKGLFRDQKGGRRRTRVWGMP